MMNYEWICAEHVRYCGLLNFNDLIEKISFRKGWKCKCSYERKREWSGGDAGSNGFFFVILDDARHRRGAGAMGLICAGSKEEMGFDIQI